MEILFQTSDRKLNNHTLIQQRQILQQNGVFDAFHYSHANNPNLFDPDCWELKTNLDNNELKGKHAVIIAFPHQGDHKWAAVFDSDELDARVYLRWDETNEWVEIAPTIGMFFWDTAQIGLIWGKVNPKYWKKGQIKETDIGLTID